jgi:hypothetical protein
LHDDQQARENNTTIQHTPPILKQPGYQATLNTELSKNIPLENHQSQCSKLACSKLTQFRLLTCACRFLFCCPVLTGTGTGLGVGVAKCFELMKFADDFHAANGIIIGGTIGFLYSAVNTTCKAYDKEPNNTSPCSFYLEQSDDLGEEQDLLDQEGRTKIKWRSL